MPGLREASWRAWKREDCARTSQAKQGHGPTLSRVEFFCEGDLDVLVARELEILTLCINTVPVPVPSLPCPTLPTSLVLPSLPQPRT